MQDQILRRRQSCEQIMQCIYCLQQYISTPWLMNIRKRKGKEATEGGLRSLIAMSTPTESDVSLKIISGHSTTQALLPRVNA